MNVLSFRVAIDVSPLKHGRASDPRRSGLFRVTEGLVSALAEHPRCELVPVAPQSYRALLEARAYAAGGNAALSRRLAVPFCAGARARLEDLTASLHGTAANGNNRNLLQVTSRAVQKLSGGSGFEFAARQVSTCDVFHSPAYPLPADIVPRKRRFLTCHDVLPVLRPDLFQPEHIAFAKEILQSIRPDDHVICVSEATAADFREIAGHPVSHIHVVHSAADRGLFYEELESGRKQAVAAKYGISTPYILSVGTLEPRKNLGHVVKAFAALVDQQHASDLTLVLVGGAGWGPDIGNLITLHPRIARQIVRTGYVPDADLAPLYSGARAFVYMSLFEGFGLPLLEAMQCGTPVIGSNITALREVAGGAGTLLEPNDVDALADAMWRFHCNASERAAAGRAVLERAARFTWKDTAEAVMRTYEIALTGC